MTSDKKATIYDVAAITGLSIATISRVINRKGGYSKETEKIVNRAIKKLSFVPNSMAKNLASNTNKTIGLVISFTDAPPYSLDNYLIQFLHGVTIMSTKYDYDIFLDNHTIYNYIKNKTIVNSKLYKGIIFSHLFKNSLSLVEELLFKKIPVVYAGAQIEKDKIGLNVYGGYAEYKRSSLELLYKKGHKKIIVFETNLIEKNNNIPICRQVIKSFLNDNNLDKDACKLVLYDFTIPNQFQSLLRDILNKHTLPDAIFTDNIASANLTYNILNSFNLRIPEDVSILSCVFQEYSGEEFHPTLSTVFVNAFEMGNRAVELLISQIEKDNKEFGHFVPYKIIQRESIKDRIL